MQLGVHVARFDWHGGPDAIGGRLSELAAAVEAAGCEHISVMDHYFQIDRMFAVEDPMLEAYTTLGFLAVAPSG